MKDEERILKLSRKCVVIGTVLATVTVILAFSIWVLT